MKSLLLVSSDLSGYQKYNIQESEISILDKMVERLDEVSCDAKAAMFGDTLVNEDQKIVITSAESLCA